MDSRRFLLSLALTAAGASAAFAQPSTGAGPSLPDAAHVGDHVVVVGTGGRETRGLVRAVSETSITVNRRVFDVDGLQTIRQTDSLADGTMIGLAAGLAVSVAAALRCHRYIYSEERGLCVAASVGSGLLTLPVGALVGRSIDRARGDREVYRRRPAVSLAWTRRGPVVDVSMRW